MSLTDRLVLAFERIALEFNEVRTSLESAGVLFGLGPPDNAVGSEGAFYFDDTDNTLYGPKAPGDGLGTPFYAQGANTPDTTTVGDYKLGNTYKVLVGGQIEALRFYRDAAAAVQARTLQLYENGVLVATSNPTSESATSGWVTATLATPVVVVPGRDYTVAYRTPSSGPYVSKAAAPAVTDSSKITWVGGRYDVGTAGYPSQAAAGSNFFVDLQFKPATSLWPVALESGSGGGVIPVQATADPEWVDGQLWWDSDAPDDSGDVAASARKINTGTGLLGGGDLTADRTLSVDFAAIGAATPNKAVRADDPRLLGGVPTALVATTTNITLSGLQTIDGIAAAAGDTVLVKNQTNPTQNGPWVAAAGAWSRHPNFLAAADLASLLVRVTSGTQAGLWHTTFDRADTVGTSPVPWYSLVNEGSSIMYPAPIGATMWWDGPETTIPVGWVKRDGSELPIASYPTLYSRLTNGGTVFPHGANTNGSGAAGTTHFRLPNLKGRTQVGHDPSQTEFDTVGETGGAKTVTLTANQSGIQAHTHALRQGTNATAAGTGDKASRSSSGDDGNFRTSSVTVGEGYGSASYPNGKDAIDAHNNLPPYQVSIPIIKASDGLAPVQEMTTQYPSKRYSIGTGSAYWVATWGASDWEIPETVITVPPAPYERTAWIGGHVQHDGGHANRFAIWVNGARLTDQQISTTMSTNPYYATSWTGVKHTIPANATHRYSVYTNASDSTGGANITERHLMIDVFPGAGGEHTIGHTTLNYEGQPDTGLRDITSLMSSSFRSTFPASKVYARRIGKQVSIHVAINQDTAGGALSLFVGTNFPPGFAKPDFKFPHSNGFTYHRAWGTVFCDDDGNLHDTGIQIQTRTSDNETQLAMYAVPANAYVHGKIEFTTDEPWPVSLPGVAA